MSEAVKYEMILLKAGQQAGEIGAFLKSLRSRPEPEFYPVLQEVHNDVFAKTDCLACAACCKSIPPILTDQDVSRLARRLEMSRKQFVRHYVLMDFNGEMTLNGVPCRFLGSDNACQVYEDRPEACRRYPHTDEKGYQKRAELNLANTQVCPAAYNIVIQLMERLNPNA
jgi:Fe-S-cluster containining protein